MGNERVRRDGRSGASATSPPMRPGHRDHPAGVPPFTRERGDVQMLATWALRIGAGGWAMVRDGAVRVTNRVFDALDRDSIIGPGWQDLDHDDPTGEHPDERGRSLADIVTDEARLLIRDGQLLRRRRFRRGGQVVEVTTERSRVGGVDPTMVVAQARELSDLALAEARLAELQERLREREQLTRAGELAMRVGHDLGNLVGALNARLMLLEADGSLDDGTLRSLQAIAEAQSALIGRLKSVASRPPGQPEPVDLLSEVIRPAIQLVESTLQQPTRRQAVVVRIDPKTAQLPRVLAVRDDLVNLLINLLVNARDAMPDGGQIWICGAASDDEIRLSVEDQGTGIPAEVLPRIFDPFFSTKGTGGTGMGLAMARQLMRGLGGDVTARNRPEGGAAFDLRFPSPTSMSYKIENRPGDPSPGEAT